MAQEWFGEVAMAVNWPSGAIVCPYWLSPQHSAVPSVRMAQEWYDEVAMAVNWPVGGVNWLFRWRLPHRMPPVSRNPQDCKVLTEMSMNRPPSRFSCPASLLPQQAMVWSVRIAQEWPDPAEMAVNWPSGGSDWPY